MVRPLSTLPELVSATGAGKILNTSKQYVARLAARGQLVGTRLDGTGAWAFRKDYVEAYAREHGKLDTTDTLDG